MNDLLTEEEYDRLPDLTQRQYCYCQICEMFFSIKYKHLYHVKPLPMGVYIK